MGFFFQWYNQDRNVLIVFNFTSPTMNTSYLMTTSCIWYYKCPLTYTSDEVKIVQDLRSIRHYLHSTLSKHVDFYYGSIILKRKVSLFHLSTFTPQYYTFYIGLPTNYNQFYNLIANHTFTREYSTKSQYQDYIVWEQFRKLKEFMNKR